MYFSPVIVLVALVAIAHAQYYGHPEYLGYGYGAPVGYAGFPGYAHAPVAAAPLARAPLGLAAQAPLTTVVPRREDAEYDPNPQYTFSYQVDDAVTGDSKAHTESRQGDVVQGSYTLVEPDGSRRTVDYTADPVSGFNAVVRKDGGVTSAPVASAPLAVAATPGGFGTPVAVSRGPVYVGRSPYGVYRH